MKSPKSLQSGWLCYSEYSTVDEEDLWQSLAVVSDLPVDLESVMYGWTHQPGFPLVTVVRDDKGCISVKQVKYNEIK